MNKILLPFLLPVFIAGNISAQDDSLLTKRLSEILVYTQQKNTEKVLDYTFPKLFKIVSRKQMADAINGMYDTEEFNIDLDSLFTIKVHPVFKIEGKEYCKIIHNMVMRMKFKKAIDTTGAESEANFYLEMMGDKYGKENVRFDAANNTLVIKSASDMIAIKENNDWYFANYDEDNPKFLDLLFSKAVQNKYKTYQ